MVEIKGGLGPEVKVSAPPADWKPDHIKVECEELASFLVTDNPGDWGPYTFRPKFHCKAKERTSGRGNTLIMRYQLAQDQFLLMMKGKVEKAGWDFHYKGWLDPTNSKFRSGASYNNPFPATRKGNLDYGLLKHMGLTKAIGWKSMTPCSFGSCFSLFVILSNQPLARYLARSHTVHGTITSLGIL
jgi:hypothetical protein